MHKLIATLLILFAVIPATGRDAKLSGSVIGTATSVDYATSMPSTTVNTAAEAFDGDFNTCFAAYPRSFGWVGLDLGTPHIITGIAYAARNDGLGPGRMQLGVFQGANNPDFSDAIPIYLIPEPGKIGELTYVDTHCSKGFRYVRYVGPNDARCNVAEIEFYGIEGEGNEKALYQPTNLPLVVVNTPNMQWFTDDKNFEMNGSQIYVIADGKIDTGATGQIRGRGNASWNFPKKPFRIKFDSKQKVLGGPAKAKKWTMINNYGDKTLMRNKLAFDFSERFDMAFTPACHFVDCIFNGEYQGTYQLCDQIEVGSGRVDIKSMKETDTEGEALTGGYLVEIDAYASSEPAAEWFETYGPYRLQVTIKDPDPGVTQQYNFIRNKVTQLEQLLASSSYADPEKGYRKVLDLDTFLKHFLINELAGNTDTYWSTYMSLDRGAEQFNVGPVWDFDLGFDNDNRTYPVNNHNDFICSVGSYAQGMRDVVNRIIYQDKAARERLTYLWSYARLYGGIDEATLLALVDKYAAELNASQDLNFKRWPILNQYVHQNPRTYGSYVGEVDNVRTYIRRRLTKLDRLIGRVEIEDAVPSTLPDEAPEITIAGNLLTVTGAGTHTIYDLQGRIIATASGTATHTLSPGFYLIHTPGATRKIAIPSL